MVDARQATSAPKQEIRLEDYRAPDFEIEALDLLFKLEDDHALVEARSRVRKVSREAKNLVLDGGPYMDLISVSLDGRALAAGDYRLAPDELKIKSVPDLFELKIVTKLYPKGNTRLEGLYFSGGNFCTQCEAEGFRHITYFLDRPDILTRYKVRIEASKATCPILLSNGNPTDAGDLADGRHFAEWEDPHPKPSYLFALVAGNLGCLSDRFTTHSGRDVTLNIYADEQDLQKCGHAMESLKRSMTWDEEVYGLEYDLDIYNIVAVSDFNMGAMENKGLNIFNTKYVLASPDTATDADFDHVEGVIGHEYFHNWTGNRVTCRDWFQLSLKEGLTVFRDQEFSSDMTSRAVKRLDDVRVLRMLQFPEDGGPLAHPVRPEKYIEINNFYTTTVYNKGAEVIRMMHRLIGAEAFRKGMDLYFERYDGQAVTCEDFVAAMEAASGADLGHFRVWYSQAGTPSLQVTRRRDGNDVVLTIEQSCAPTPGQPVKKTYHMPLLVGWMAEDGQEVRPDLEGDGYWTEEGCLLNLTEGRQSFRFRNLTKGAVPSLLRGFTAPVTMKHDLDVQELAFLAAHDTDAFARWEAAQDMFSNILLAQVDAGRGEVEVPAILDEVIAALLKDESTDPALLAELLSLPGEIALGQKMKVMDPDAIHQAREAIACHLAQVHASQIMRRYEALAADQYSDSQPAKAARRLRNVLLGYVAMMPDGEDIVSRHYSDADNMTDRFAALSLISDSDFDCREQVLTAFYTDWRHNDLVVDKWFAVQAKSKRADTVNKVKALINHEAFTLKNPNRLRSLISTFAMLNQVRFHELDGSGYSLLGDMIAKVDEINPQTAARLVPPLGRWGRVSGVRQRQMKDALKGILDKPNLSSDVKELVEKSLA